MLYRRTGSKKAQRRPAAAVVRHNRSGKTISVGIRSTDPEMPGRKRKEKEEDRVAVAVAVVAHFRSRWDRRKLLQC